MEKLTKGALAMVLAGSVTFSVTNALLVDESSKRLTKDNALIISGVQKKADVIDHEEKTVKDQTPTSIVKDGQTKISHDIPASQDAFKNRDKSDIAIADIQQDTEKISKSTTTNPAVKKVTVTGIKAPTRTTASTATGTKTTSVTTKPEATTKPATSPKAPTKPATSPKAPTRTTAPTPTGTNSTTAATTTANRGQQVSTAVQEKAASLRDQKGNNGKEM
ncbi:hypothetical protein [Bacillus sp. UMB0893]|uniref:hypothetical protein n=1 Tax=Bacillus sp. UMB0893 TaxID=2066053 RepID=UPI000C764358|nr:hypothetical protein [Bacillus sp. UMB0893]PLR67728.1 hypothetical protein CYJ36_10365 [Bacillus sp. UMB0893]